MIKPVYNAFKMLFRWGAGSWLKGLVVTVFGAAVVSGGMYLGADLKEEHDTAKAEVAQEQ